MSVSDKKIKVNAIPFEAQPFSRYGNVQTDYGAGAGGLFVYTTDVQTLRAPGLGVVRMNTPLGSNLIEAALNLTMQVNSSLGVKVAIGRFDTDGISPVTSYTQAEIDAMHFALTGQSGAIMSSGGVLFLDGVQIGRLIPKQGDAGYNSSGFVLILQFTRNRTSTDLLKRFNVQATAEMGLV